MDDLETIEHILLCAAWHAFTDQSANLKNIEQVLHEHNLNEVRDIYDLVERFTVKQNNSAIPKYIKQATADNQRIFDLEAKVKALQAELDKQVRGSKVIFDESLYLNQEKNDEAY